MEIQKMLNAQTISYNCAIAVAQELREGWTEKQTAKLMDTWLKDHGVKSFFHTSFAWFGERSAFKGMKTYLDFLPKNRAYEADQVVILDTAPIVDGYIGDIGFTFSKVQNPELVTARQHLVLLRNKIQSLFTKRNEKDIWQEVDKEIRNAGYENCYERYPFSVLGHRVGKAKAASWQSFALGFGIQAYLTTLSTGLKKSLLTKNYKNDLQGAWAIEPHIGLTKFGAKFEEILIVDDDGARWLSDKVPHLDLPKGLY